MRKVQTETGLNCKFAINLIERKYEDYIPEVSPEILGIPFGPLFLPTGQVAPTMPHDAGATDAMDSVDSHIYASASSKFL